MEIAFGILAYGAVWALETVFLVLALWFMVRIQKLQYTIPGLVLSAGIACALDLIPYVGHYIAMAVLWVCLTKVTREDFTGVVFTAAISYALVFGMNLFLLGALMGDLRVSARESSSAQEALSLAAESEEESESASLADLDPEDAMEPPGGTAPAKPAQVNPPATAALNRAQAGAVPPSPAPNLQAAMSRAPVSAKPPVTSAFALKAILQNGTNSTAMVFTGVRTYSITLGDTIFVQTTEGAKSVRLEALDATSAVLDVAGEEVRLAP